MELAKMFPEAPIYTFLYNERKMGQWFFKERVRTSFLQKFPKFFRSRPQYLWPFFGPAAENFDLREYDLVISSSSVFSKGVVTRPRTIHVCYAHSASRFAWDYSFEYLRERKLGFFGRFLAKIYLSYFRIWDRASARRPDYFLANSCATAQRLKKYYGVEAKVIYPPVPLANGKWPMANSKDDNTEEYFLIVSQLTPYKKIDVAVEAFNKLELPLIIIGEGPQKKYLENLAKPNIQILGWKSDEETAEYFRNCAAFIFPGEDDFGIAPVEAMSFGKPVLALARGGAKETVLAGITGEFFEEPAVEILADGVRRLRQNLTNFNPAVIRKWAERYSVERFRREIMEFIEKVRYN